MSIQHIDALMNNADTRLISVSLLPIPTTSLQNEYFTIPMVIKLGTRESSKRIIMAISVHTKTGEIAYNYMAANSKFTADSMRLAGYLMGFPYEDIPMAEPQFIQNIRDTATSMAFAQLRMFYRKLDEFMKTQKAPESETDFL